MNGWLLANNKPIIRRASVGTSTPTPPNMASSEETPTALVAKEPSHKPEDIIEVTIKVEGDPPTGDSTRTSEAPFGEAPEPRKPKRRSGNSVDLTYRYHDPSEDELSWTEDDHGNRRRRKSRKRKSGGGDDFKNGIMYVSLGEFWLI